MTYIAPQLAHDVSMAHEFDPEEPTLEYLRRLLAPVPTNGTWVMEPKFDGWRWQTHVLMTEPGAANWVKSIGGRNGKDHSGSVPEIDQALAHLPAGTVLDGELVWEGGLVGSRATKKATYVVFDVLRLGDESTMSKSWTERRLILENEIAFDGQTVVLAPVTDVDEHSAEILAGWVELGVEGAVVKRKSAPYLPGSRRRDGFVKIKPKQSTEAVVLGWEYGKGDSNRSRCGALSISLVDTNQVTTCGYDATPEEADAIVGRMIEVQHWGWQPSGKVRHPGFVRFRPDREPIETIDQAIAAQDAVNVETTRMLVEKETEMTSSYLPGEGGQPETTGTSNWLRNYGAMGEAKLRDVVAQLRAGSGDAVDRVTARGGSLEANLAAAERAAESKGLTV
jgi:ATP-dependent DNA ligase